MNDENVKKAVSWLRESMDEMTDARDIQTMVNKAIHLLDPPPPPKPSQAERIAVEMENIMKWYASDSGLTKALQSIAAILREKP